MVFPNQVAAVLALGKLLGIIRIGKGLVTLSQDNVVHQSWYWWHGLPVRQHYKVAIKAYGHKSEPICITL